MDDEGMDPGASSLFLHFLAQLGQDTAAQVLLPKLLDQGSGPALAATCSQLQVLVHSSVTCLALNRSWQTGNPHDPGLMEAWIAALPDHFPSCNHVCLEVPFPAASCSMPYVISTLARLPKLDTISIEATFPELSMVALSAVLYGMRTQLTGLKSLALDLQFCDAISLGDTWQELGRATQLTGLDVELAPRSFGGEDPQEDPTDYLKDAAALSALQRLRVLRMTDECTDREQTVDWSFVSCLTALTELALVSSGSSEGKAAIGSCIALRGLTLSSAADLTDPAALAQLTGLTRLNLGSDWVFARQECAQALGCLKHVRWLSAGHWAPELLHVLQGLPQLSIISGQWMWSAEQLGSVQLPQVCRLLNAGGRVPVEAFPRLIRAQFDGPDSVVLPKLATCCPQLQELDLVGLEECSSPRDFAFAPTTKGLQSLSGLQHLQRLQLEVKDEATLAAAAAACMVLGQGSLKLLHLSVLHCRFSSLLVLSKLAKLDVLHLALWQTLPAWSPKRTPGVKPTVSVEQSSREEVRLEDAGLLLSGLSAVRKVIICCANQQVQAALRAAAAWAAEWGLPVACEVDVVVQQSDVIYTPMYCPSSPIYSPVSPQYAPASPQYFQHTP